MLPVVTTWAEGFDIPVHAQRIQTIGGAIAGAVIYFAILFGIKWNR